MRSLIPLIISIAVVVEPSLIAPHVHARTYLGAGGTICGDYLQIQRVAPDAAKGIDLWLLGYVSGLNFMNYASQKVDLLQHQEHRDVVNFVNGYCFVNLGKTLNNAANEYWIQISERVGLAC